MNIKIPPSLKKFLRRTDKVFSRYGFEVYVLLIMLVLGFLVFEIRQFANPPRNEDLYNEQLLTLTQGRFDQKVIDRAKTLIDSNVDVKQIYLEGRDNPFSE